MATTQTVRLDVIADISKYQQQFSKIPGFTDKQAARAAEKLVKRLQKAQDQAERDARKAAQSAAREWQKTGGKGGGIANTAKALDNVSDKAGEVDSVLAGVAGVLDTIDPKLGAVARGFGDAAGGIEAVSRGAMLSIPALGAVGVAVAAAGAAYLVFAHNLEEAEAAEERARQSAERMSKAHGSFTQAIEDTNVELEKLLGTYDEEGQKQEERDSRIRQAATQQINAYKEEQKALQARRKDVLENQRVDESTEATLASLDAQIRQYGRQIDEVRAKEADALEQSELLAFGQRAQAEAALAAEKAGRAKAAADAAAADAARRLAEEEARRESQLDALRAASEARNAQIDKDIELQRKLAQVTESTAQVQLTASQKVASDATRRLNEAEAIAEQRRMNAAGDQALQQQIDREHDAARLAILQDFEAQRTAVMSAAVKERARLAEQERQQQIATAGAFTQTTLSSLSETLSNMSQIAASSGAGKRARRLFKASKALNATMTLMSTFQAAQGALLPPPVGFGPIAGPAAATAITAAGLTRVALIRQQKMPKFYRGTEDVGGGSRDAIPAMLHRREAVVNDRGADIIGRDTIRRANQGRAPGERANVVAISTIDHRQFRDFYRDDRSLPGSLTRRDRATGSTIGRQLR